MCLKANCASCNKPTWVGCGLHIESALAGVAVKDRCPGWHGGAAGGCAKADTATSTTVSSVKKAEKGTRKHVEWNSKVEFGGKQGQQGLQELCCLKGHTDRVWCAAWSPSGSVLATCSGDRTIRIWGIDGAQKWEMKQLLEKAHSRTVRCVAWSPDGRKLASASFDGTIMIWALEEGEFVCIATLEGHENEVKAVAWSPSGQVIASCSRDKSVWLWEVVDGEDDFECLSVLHGHSQDVKQVKFHPSEETLLSCSYDDQIKVWKEDEDDWYCTQTFSEHTSTVWAIAFEPSGQRLVSSSGDKSIMVWDYKKKGTDKVFEHSCTLSGHSKRTVYSVDWSRDGLIASAGADDAINIFREALEERKEDGHSSWNIDWKQEKAHQGDVNCVAWNPAHKGVLASVGDDNLVRVWKYWQPAGDDDAEQGGGDATAGSAANSSSKSMELEP